MITKEVLDELIRIGAMAAPIRQHTGAEPVVIIPHDQKVESLARYFPPQRIQQRVALREAASFIDYTNRFKNGNTLILANASETGAQFTAVLDYHGPGPKCDPEFCLHVATFVAEPTPEWKIWLGADRKAFDQVGFATWLEDNMGSFVQPAGADLLELVRSLHGHRNARFNTALRLDNGAYSVGYEEDISVRGASSTASGDMELPPFITAGMAVFQVGSLYEVKARLKTRVAERKLALFFETVNLHVIVRESIAALVKEIGDKTQIKPLMGAV